MAADNNVKAAFSRLGLLAAKGRQAVLGWCTQLALITLGYILNYNDVYQPHRFGVPAPAPRWGIQVRPVPCSQPSDLRKKI